MPTWFEHVDLMNVLIAVLFTIVAWFMVRSLNKIDNNQTILFNRLQALEIDFYKLYGEHHAQSRKNIH